MYIHLRVQVGVGLGSAIIHDKDSIDARGRDDFMVWIIRREYGLTMERNGIADCKTAPNERFMPPVQE